jgi:hypothetical protein
MARNGGYRFRGVVDSFTTKIQTQLGLLALSSEQCALDRMGFPRQSICSSPFAGLPCGLKHQRRNEESK